MIFVKWHNYTSSGFPAGCLHSQGIIAYSAPLSPGGFQHTAGFYNGPFLFSGGTVIVTAAVYRGFGSGLLPGYPGFIPPLNLPALGRRQSPYIDLSSLRRPVFLVNSRHRLFTATLFGSRREVLHLLRAPLLPKLRGQFAEFLGRGSPARLRILSPPTCVGLGTVRCQPPIEALSWQCGISQFTLPRQGSPSALGSEPHRLQCLDLPDTLPTTLDPDDHRRAGLPSCVTP